MLLSDPVVLHAMEIAKESGIGEGAITMNLGSTGMPAVCTLRAYGAPAACMRWAMILIGMFVLVTLYWPMQASAATPEETLKAYLRAIYAQDYGVAYYLISPADRKLKRELICAQPTDRHRLSPS